MSHETDCAHWDGVPFEGLDVRHWGFGPDTGGTPSSGPEPAKNSPSGDAIALVGPAHDVDAAE